MLHELHISGLGVIEDLDLEFDPGLNVLTGETGAGKTMVTVGLVLTLGGRASATLVRRATPAASVEARFDATRDLREAGWADDGEVVLARRVGADGRSSARIGGRLAPVSALSEIGSGLVEVHGQHEGQRLLSAAAQAAFLDRFAGRAHVDAVVELASEHARLRDALARLDAVVAAERDRERELDVIGYQVREIEGAAPVAGELAELEAEESRLAHSERLQALATEAEVRLAADDAAADSVRRAAAALVDAAGLDPSAEALAGRIAELEALAGELARDVRAYRELLAADPGRLEEVRDRIHALQALRRKYGDTEADVLTFLDRARDRLELLSRAGAERGRLERETAERSHTVTELAAVVSAGRAAAAPELAEALGVELAELGMEGARVEIALLPLDEIAATGAERPEIVFSAGPGQAPLPLAKVASGGELSRMMLAFRSVLIDLDDVPTLVFDEVDVGIGGRAGVAVGRRLAALAAARQVLVVTHLPQIASFADRHIRVEKRGGTATVEVLDDAGRVAELSRMLSGLPESESAATHAEELLAEAGRAKQARTTTP